MNRPSSIWRGHALNAVFTPTPIKIARARRSIQTFAKADTGVAGEAGIQVVMDRCPKIELFRPFWKPKLHLEI